MASGLKDTIILPVQWNWKQLPPVVSSNHAHVELNSIQQYVIMFVSHDLQHSGQWFSPGTPVSFTNKTYGIRFEGYNYFTSTMELEFSV
jgi:hypothetical protein